MNRLATGALATAALWLWCALAGAASAQQSTAPAQSVAAPDPASIVVATVDGDNITLAEVQSVQATLPEQYRTAPLEMLYTNLLDQIIERRVIAHAAEAQGLDRQPEIERRIARARETVLLEAFVTEAIAPAMTEENIRARYEAKIAAEGGDDEVHARHILVAEEADAKDIRKQLDGGADFTELAKQHSTGPSAPRGGDLGFFRKKDMVPEFSEAAFALEAGQISAPVKTQFGWHVIMVVERRTAPPPAFEALADELRKEVAREAVTELVENLRGKARIQLFNPDGTPIVAPSGSPATK